MIVKQKIFTSPEYICVVCCPRGTTDNAFCLACDLKAQQHIEYTQQRKLQKV